MRLETPSPSPILYIAGPMTGLPEYNHPAFHAAAAELTEWGYTALNPAGAEQDNPTPGKPQSWQWYMRRALRTLSHADGVALLDGWVNSRGAKLEHHVAVHLDLPCHSVNYWIAYRQEIAAEHGAAS